jgi:hypothetical protein
MEPAILTPLHEPPGPWASVQVDTAWTDESTTTRRQALPGGPHGNGERT